LTITVNPNVTPTFAAVAPICSGQTLSALPTTATNGITGTWLPALNNLATTTYTFTPTAGLCATTTTLTITVNPNVTPTFAAVAPVCFGETIASLPTTSTNGITGTWSPALNNLATTTYTFTPTAGLCALSVQLSIVVLPQFDVIAFGECQGASFVLTANPVNNSFNPETSDYEWKNSSGIVIGFTQSVIATEIGNYTVTVTSNGCSSTSAPFSVDNVVCLIQRGISANGDGLNDCFQLSSYDVKNLQIFNRYGMKVYSKSGYSNEWCGQSDSGDNLPDGTYYYVINRNNGETKTGWIYINRAQ
jgi:gliding motility-associated-like protein